MLHSKMKEDRQGGFTLIELMFTVVVLAVLLGIGIPSFREFTQGSRMATAANNLLADFNYARSEAIKRRQPVTICRSDDEATCTTDAGRFRDWIIFLDSTEAAPVLDDPLTADDETAAAINAGNGVVDTDEIILKTGSMDQSITPKANGRRMVYAPSGFPDTDITETVTQLVLCDARGNTASAGENSAARAIEISAVGRPTLYRDKATITTLGNCP